MRWFAIIFAVVVTAPSHAAGPSDLELLALSQDTAIVRIAGKRHVLRVGQGTVDGVKLVSADTERAVVEVNGVVETLEYGVVLAPITEGDGGSGPNRVTLWVGPGGMFQADGAINGYSVRFLVDTGASTVAISSVTARRLGIDLSRGTPGIAQTASGITEMMSVTLDSVSIGSLTVRNVPAGVIYGPYPDIPLLGTSFLGNFDMERQGNRLELIERY